MLCPTHYRNTPGEAQQQAPRLLDSNAGVRPALPHALAHGASNSHSDQLAMPLTHRSEGL
jgi:hypothetical protein